MAISIANKGSIFSGTNATSYSTASYTPAASRLLLALIVNVNNVAGTDPVEPVVTGNGLTWAKIATYMADNVGQKTRISLWGALTGATPSAGALTADFSADTTAQLGCNIIVDEVTGADISGTVATAIVQAVTGTANGSGTSETITLAALASANNASYGAFNKQAQEAYTVGTGYTEILQGGNLNPASQSLTEYKAAGSTTVDCSWVTNIAKGGIAVEIKLGTTLLTADQGSFAESGQAAAFAIAQVSDYGSFS